ncbi:MULTISPECIES: flagellar basal body L-ring protein FlgH [Thermodesulfovibrio]|jgi:flagellar L-ring protein precursor FlgH|uniref:Flagellar L-ring protein n=1 Tax=Thermodesulfovibrio yellowstonii (strain ATCC 51303 / DSM 11347 / YP87) TaxID=289376 RepID=FLGH_THEYD|nr:MULTISPECIES: flagellar basal body L-ring protein FlgH [Thermodesulfovibrio]B5YIX2.1 RecName: Full=Flagellar L-ring protein; AltName: Full=Basal body L-ring protein; Flags: Precursor [Thermodesulfovibrio yellowstonii DSM 11347]ACI20513.1 flagellar L-ring protein FlgH [Thermodesulfovibrio yellowstonii DSM 11347]MDI6864452.1 flagellar basal body L-ring protein FlgH [Thermodesulfovibrio yellowstonii]
MRKLILISLCIFFLASCSELQEVRDIKNAGMPPKYYPEPPQTQVASEGSLWRNKASLYEDKKARRVNDLVTILINESTSAQKTASTTASRDSSTNYGLDTFFGMNTDFNIHNLPLINGFYKAGNVFSPSVKGSATSDFKGDGDTARTGKITGTITAKVVEVLPNGNLVIESRKEVIVNNEKEILVLRGIIRPDDISQSNTILSQYVADAQIYLVGEGTLGDKQSQGWLVRFLDKIWPF